MTVALQEKTNIDFKFVTMDTTACIIQTLLIGPLANKRESIVKELHRINLLT